MDIKVDAKVTRDSLQALIDNGNEAKRIAIVGRALVHIWHRQTVSEKNSDSTTEANGVGFAGCDARTGSVSAKVYNNTGQMKDWVLEKWLKKNTKGFSRITKYHRQLNEIATADEVEFIRRIANKG